MVKLTDNFLYTLNRGDTFSTPLFINLSGKMRPMRHILKDGETVYFNVMEANVPFEDAIIKKVYTKADLNPYGDVEVYFTTEDTINVEPGNYYFEVKFEHKEQGKDTYVETLIPRRKFIIIESEK